MARGLQTLQVLSVVCVAAVVVAGYLAAQHMMGMARHIAVGFLAALFVAFTHSMTLFYLIGSSGNVREAIRPYGWKEYLPRMARFHRVLSPWLTFAILAAIAAVITGGGAHTKVWPAWLHQVTALATLAINGIAAWKGIAVIRENVALQRELDAALRREQRRGAEGA
ncbi:MAG TPA: hypothetical protein VNI57_03255 [Candidatus Saccharimonadales bacterium]|nr:hypothetical protein [Candidatus Saccharimonadales bacterium]